MAHVEPKTFDTSVASDPSIREHRITDMHVIAWALTVSAFGILWVAFQLTLIASAL